jgi:hypothetical protein
MCNDVAVFHSLPDYIAVTQFPALYLLKGIHSSSSMSSSRVRLMAYSGFYKSHLLHGLPGSLLPLDLYQTPCFNTCSAPILTTYASLSCLHFLILSVIENTLDSFLVLILNFMQPCTYCTNLRSPFPQGDTTFHGGGIVRSNEAGGYADGSTSSWQGYLSWTGARQSVSHNDRLGERLSGMVKPTHLRE